MRTQQAAMLALGALLLLLDPQYTAAQGQGGGSSGRSTTGALAAALGGTAGRSAPAVASDGSSGSCSQVAINELMISNKQTLKDEDGKSPGWVELFNPGSSAVSLAGYKLTSSPNASQAWTFPSGVSLAPGQYLLVFASGKNRTNPSSPLHTDFKLLADDGYLALLAPDGSVACAVQYPDMPTDVSFGSIGGAGVVSAAQERSPQYALLASPTPGKENSGPRPGGPLIVGTTRTANPRPTGGTDIPITTTVTEQQSPLQSVELVYVVGYGTETVIPMEANGDTYSASIPASAATTGSLVRWYVRASDTQGGTTRDPLFLDQKNRQYWGTIVGDAADQASLPVMELYCKDDKAPYSKADVPGCSLWLDGNFYDNVGIRRRGVTSLNWPKPKIKVDSNQGAVFKIPGYPGMVVKEMNFNSEWWEPGENTFMREPLTWQVFGQMGVESLVSFHLHTRLNGQYFGKYAFVEEMDEDSLKRWGYDVEPAAGPLWKSSSGEYSNLRWDLPVDQVQYYWKQYTTKGNNASQGQALVDFARGLAGGASVPRSKYLFDAVNLPQVVNHMAAQTLVLNQDRCTKNFYIYRDPVSSQWSMLPWDVESAFSIDRGLGGKPAPDYCILACEQWNSPLYCDHNHPQDLAVKTPWGLISAQYDLYTTGRKLLSSAGAGGASCGKPAAAARGNLLVQAARKLLQDTSTAAPQNGAAVDGLVLPPNSTIPPDYDVDQTKLGPTRTGAAGTFNYLIDAILAVPRTRQMYMRRLRTLMDTFITTGRLQDAVTQMHNQIRDEAKRDCAAWNNPGDPDRGYQQLITEQLPIRKDQLFNQYGPTGPIPLIPDSQPTSFQLTLGRVEPGPSGFVEVQNPNGFGVDLTGYRLQGAVQFAFHAGTVIPAQDSVFVAANVGAFLQRTSAPTAGQGYFVVGPLGGQLLGSAASVQLVTQAGNVVAST